MTTVLIDENIEEGRSLVEVIQTIERFYGAVLCVYDETDAFLDSQPYEPIPGVPHTEEELIASINRSMEDFRTGRVVSHEEMKRKYIPEADMTFSTHTVAVIDETRTEGRSLMSVIRVMQKASDAIINIYEVEFEQIPNFPYNPEQVREAIRLTTERRSWNTGNK